MDEEEFDKDLWTAEPESLFDERANVSAQVPKPERPARPTDPAAYVGPSFTDPTRRDSAGISWVRASDLFSSGSARVAGRGIDFEAELARRMRRIPANASRAIRNRADRLPPLSEFGRATDRSQSAQHEFGRH
jgi:hypothetical protein